MDQSVAMTAMGPSMTVTDTIAPSLTTDSAQPTMSVTQCGAGQMPDGNGGCSPCQSGFYKSQSGNTNCVPCPTNSNTRGLTGRASCSKFVTRVL